MSYEILVFLFFIVAAVYASAGFGGGSSYLALMALFGVAMAPMRAASLLCNIVVVAGGTYIFWKNGHLNFRKIAPLVFASAPLAFLGGAIPLREKTFFILLGFCLVLAAGLMFFQNRLARASAPGKYTDKPVYAALLGGGVGLLSGMVGIGGGIFLSPLLHLLRWDAPKNIAATASFFILINSATGLAGQLAQHKFVLDWTFVLPLMPAVLVGGQLGSRLSALKFDQDQVRLATAALVLYAGINILWQQFG
jgi:uncharacterized protein